MGYDNRETIYLLELSGSHSIDDSLLNFAKAYFQMNVVRKSIDLTLNCKAKKRSFDDNSQNLSFPLKVNKKADIDVFSIFDVLVEYLPDDAYTSVLLIENPICEGGKAVYGRACGDRVAVVSSSGIKNKREKYAILIHELLHTFGVDHCESFDCIMNPCSSSTHSFTLELCPSELRKLASAVPGFDAKKRWGELAVLCESEEWLADESWFVERLKLSNML